MSVMNICPVCDEQTALRLVDDKLCIRCFKVRQNIPAFLRSANNRVWLQAEINQAGLDAEADEQGE